MPGESHGQRSLAGYSPRGCKELDTTEASEHTYIYKVPKIKKQSIETESRLVAGVGRGKKGGGNGNKLLRGKRFLCGMRNVTFNTSKT